MIKKDLQRLPGWEYVSGLQILNQSRVARIVYMEAQPESNLNLDGGLIKFTGIG